MHCISVPKSAMQSVNGICPLASVGMTNERHVSKDLQQLKYCGRVNVLCIGSEGVSNVWTYFVQSQTHIIVRTRKVLTVHMNRNQQLREAVHQL